MNRRGLFALGGLGAVGLGTGTLGPELDFLTHGLTVRLVRWKNEWCIVVPDFEGHKDWRPGEVHATKGMPVNEFLAELDKMSA